MRKDFKYAQKLQAAFGRPKDPGAASGRLKVAFSERKMCLISHNINYDGPKLGQLDNY